MNVALRITLAPGDLSLATLTAPVGDMVGAELVAGMLYRLGARWASTASLYDTRGSPATRPPTSCDDSTGAAGFGGGPLA